MLPLPPMPPGPLERPPKRRWPWILLGILLGIVLLIVLVSVVVGIVVHEAEISSKTKDMGQIVVEHFPKKIPSLQSSYEAEGLGVIINSVRYATGKDMPVAESGDMWIVVNVTVKNISGKRMKSLDVSLNLPDKITDADGNEYFGDGGLLPLEEQREMGEPLIYDELSRFNPGDVKWFPEGAEAMGNIWFSIPQNSKGLILVYEPLFGEKLQWRLII